MLSAFALRTVPRFGGALAMAGWGMVLYALFPAVLDAPAVGLVLLLGALSTALALRVASTARPVDGDGRPVPAGARTSALTAVVLWFSLWPKDPALGQAMAPFLGASFVISAAVLVGWSLRMAGRSPLRVSLFVAAGAALSGALYVAQPKLEPLFASGAALLLLGALTLPPAKSTGPEPAPWWTPFIDHPARLLVSTFACLCLGGTVLLLSPWATPGPTALEPSAAMFTAVSAVCVTGLTVIDVGSVLSGAGQVVLLVLIQLGGLGIMSFSTMAFGLLGRRLSLRHEAAVAGLLSQNDRGRVFNATRRVMYVTFGIEGTGAVILTCCFLLNGQSFPSALWGGVFTAISAFCNAGFTLTPDSLYSLSDQPVVLHTVAALIIAGGLSPVLIVATPRLFQRGALPLRAEQRLVLWATGALLFGGALVFAVFEWSHSLRALDPVDKLHNAWFQSATLRTAGFFSVDFAQLHPATVTSMLVLMFIGGSPGGTAGGIKTTTAALLLLAVFTAIRGRRALVIFGRTIPHDTVYRAAAVTTVGSLAVLGAVMLLQLTQRIPGDFILYEVVSALATVGLTLGATPMLDVVGRTIVAACMFIGRVGPLTLFMLLADRRSDDVWSYPPEDVQVG